MFPSPNPFGHSFLLKSSVPQSTPDMSHKCGVPVTSRFSSLSSVVHRIYQFITQNTNQKPDEETHRAGLESSHDRDFHPCEVGGVSYSPSMQMCLVHTPRGFQTQAFSVMHFIKVSLHRLLLINFIFVLSPHQRGLGGAENPCPLIMLWSFR